jgi:DNA primase
LTEGPLDAIITDGISAGTNTISDEQADVILSLNKHIVVLPDADKAGMQMVNAAVKYGWSVAFPEWDDCNDAGDALTKYGRLFTVRSILNSAVSNPTKIQVLGRNYCK